MLLADLQQPSPQIQVKVQFLFPSSVTTCLFFFFLVLVLLVLVLVLVLLMLRGGSESHDLSPVSAHCCLYRSSFVVTFFAVVVSAVNVVGPQQKGEPL